MSDSLLLTEGDSAHQLPRLSRKLRLGIVGGGRIAQTQAMAAVMSGYWEIRAGALSSDRIKNRTRAEQWYLNTDRVYPSFTEMASAEAARSDGVDAVMVTTPNHLHHDAATAFIDQGIAVLCDKPLTNTLAEAEQIANRVRSAKTVFGVSYVMSCFPMVRQAREMVTNGSIGRVSQIHVEFLQDWMVPDGVEDAEHVRWRLDPAKSGPTSCTGDIGTHAAHLASFVSGLEMTALRAEMHVCGAPKQLEDTVFMFTRFTGDIPGTLIATRLASGNRGGLRLRVYGSKGGIEWDLEQPERLSYSLYGEPDRVITRGHGHGVTAEVERFVRTARGFPEGLIEAWANLYSEFAIAVAFAHDGRDMKPDEILMPTVESGVAGVRFILAAVASDQQGGNWVTV